MTRFAGKCVVPFLCSLQILPGAPCKNLFAKTVFSFKKSKRTHDTKWHFGHTKRQLEKVVFFCCILFHNMVFTSCHQTIEKQACFCYKVLCMIMYSRLLCSFVILIRLGDLCLSKN